ncbi:MAG: desulfoferrodoxin [Desulfobacteraceae bacterium]|jgi:superoxide reductase|nr:desulfoferrodoxin [Desulfobacteraceae bacterium]
MATRSQIYKCEICGNVVEVLHGGEGDLVCCGAEMNLFEEKNADEGKEKHVPVIEQVGNDIKVKVGSNPHPMEEQHYIEWIEIIDGDMVCLQSLKPGDSPEAIFKSANAAAVVAREYCSIHGLWKS